MSKPTEEIERTLRLTYQLERAKNAINRAQLHLFETKQEIEDLLAQAQGEQEPQPLPTSRL